MTLTATCPRCERDGIRVNGDGSLRRHYRSGYDPCNDATTIPLPSWPRIPLTQNQLRRMTWPVEAKVKQRLIGEARWSIRAAKVEPVVEGRVVVKLHHRPATRRVLDSDAPMPTLKCAIDALVKEGVLPQGDDWRYVAESGCRIHPPLPGMPGATWLVITVDKEVDE